MKQFLCIVLALCLFSVAADAQVKKTTVKKKSVVKTKVVSSKKVPVIVQKKPVEVPGIRVKITTDSGVIVVRLYDSTPLHRDNFVKLVKEHFYDSLLFHRVIQDFMIQGGDPQSKNADPGQMLGNGGGDMQRIPAEFRTTLIHKKGVLAAARDNNPEKASSACQFYLVQGKKMTDAELSMVETQIGRKYTAIERLIYKEKGGTPFLDGNYTVFGEVVSGLNVIDKIASVQKDPNDRPFGDVRMKMEIIP
ncbi:MAG: peptidylprolyl isomerase [Ferruginibacter sp.]